jgi:hypothetical protein
MTMICKPCAVQLRAGEGDSVNLFVTMICNFFAGPLAVHEAVMTGTQSG